MKVEQLKAELVVFKGLMSNVSAAPTRLSPSEAGKVGLSALGLCISWATALTHFVVLPSPPGWPPTPPHPHSGGQEGMKALVSYVRGLDLWP